MQMQARRSNRKVMVTGLPVVIALIVVTAGVAGVAIGQESEEEPNNSQSTATPISIEAGEETVVNGILAFADEDWYSIEVEQGDRISVDYSGSPGRARIRTPDGTTLDAESPTINRLSATAAAAGTYYIQLTTIASANGDYSMTIRVQSNSTNDPETQTNNSTDMTTPVDSDSTGDEVASPTGDWPDSCSEAQLVGGSGTYKGAIDTPNDQDWLRIQLRQRGDYITLIPLIPNAESEVWIRSTAVEGIHAWDNVRVQEGIRSNDDYYVDGNEYSGRLLQASSRDGINNSSWQIFAETSPAVLCIAITENEPDEAQLPYEWQLHIDNSTTQPADLSNQVLSQEEIRRFEGRLAQLERRVDELRATIQRQENRISELEDRLNQSDIDEQSPG